MGRKIDLEPVPAKDAVGTGSASAHHCCLCGVSLASGRWVLPIGELASVDGPVPADVAFPEWLETQDRATQNEVLGVTKANAWRNGKITIEQMLGRDLEPLTLAELRSLDRIPEE